MDEQRQPIAGATLNLKDLSRGGEATFLTDKNGFFYRRNLRASQYELTISKDGYQELQDRLRLDPGEERRQDFTLESAPASGGTFEKGVEAFKRGDYAAAAEAFEETVRLEPGSPEGHANLGLAYLQLSRIEEAIAALEKASTLAPDSFATRARLGTAYVRANRLEKATEAFETALAKEHDASDPMAIESRLVLGSLYFSSGRVPDAVTTYERVLEASPSSAGALLGLGKCHFNLGDVDRARRYLEEVVSAAPDSAEASEARRFLEQLAAIERKS